MNINIKLLNILSDNIEQYIISIISLSSFGAITDKELIKIQNKVLIKYNITINLQIIASIISTYKKDYIIKHYYRLSKYQKYILDNYKSKGIIYLVYKIKLSPMTILRFIFSKTYNKKLRELISNNLLNTFDKQQLNISIDNDIYANLDQTTQSIESLKFEKQIENYLIKHNIKYITQEDLTKEQIIKYNHAINTPDFLIKSNLIINNHKINWIDAKNFYGSNINFVKDKINKQIKKYIKEYGSGCIIFNHGFNSEIQFNNVLILDYDSL